MTKFSYCTNVRVTKKYKEKTMKEECYIDLNSFPQSNFDLDKITDPLPEPMPGPRRFHDWYAQNITQQNGHLVFDALMKGSVQEMCFPHDPYSVERIKKEKQKVKVIKIWLRCTNANNQNEIFVVREELNVAV